MSTIDHDTLEAALNAAPGADPDLSALVRDVRAQAPTMTPHFAARLDDKVAALPKQGRAPRVRSWFAPQRLLPVFAAVALLAIVSAAALTLTVGNGDDEEGGASQGSAASSQLQEAAPLSTGRAAAPSGARVAPAAPGVARFDRRRDQAGQAGSLAGPRKVQRDAQLTLTTAPDDVQDVADRVVSTTQDVDGIVASSSVDVSDTGGTASFNLRIPTRRLDDALKRLSDLAHVGSLRQGSTDITGSFVSAADRLSDARAERRALLKALGKASAPATIDSLRQRIRGNRSQIGRLKGDLEALRRRADLASVSVTVSGTGASKGDEGAGGPWTPGDAARDAVRVLEVVAGVLLVAAAILGPLAVLALLAALAARGLRRRGREQALDAA